MRALLLVSLVAIAGCDEHAPLKRERRDGAQCIEETQKYGTSYACLRGRVLTICNHNDECLIVALDAVAETP